MGNPLFNQFGRQAANPYSQLMADARRLRQTLSNPRAEVERLLNSGAMSQSDFNRLAPMAQQISAMMQKN